MKTNEWLAYFVTEHKVELATLLAIECSRENLRPTDADLAGLLTTLESDFDAETFDATAAAFADLGSDKNSSKIIWGQIEQKMTDYISEEEEMTGGAKRLAYLRLSTFTQELNSAWRSG